MMQVDIHQHLWSASLVEALRRRTVPPRLDGWTLELPGEPAHVVDPGDHDPDARAAVAAADGVEVAVVSLSSALGIESLPPAEAWDVLDAYHAGALALPAPFHAWAATCLTEVDPAALERELERGFVGLELPATALSDVEGYAGLESLLDVLERSGRPLFIHPGPTPPGVGDVPAWWPAMVTYVQQMHAAWFAFRSHGRRRHPRLRVCFAMLAGLAPLHGERFAARAGHRTVIDENAFLDISSYGTRAVDATVRVQGIDVLVNGSDRPYASPVAPDLGPAALHSLRSTAPLRLLDLKKKKKEEVAHAHPVAAGA